MDNQYIIKVENLTKKFNGLAAVDNISFSVEEGEIFAFLGPNGAGKTTTIKMMTTLLLPTSGKMMLNGFDVLSDKGKVRSSFGIVFQDPSLDDQLTAFENMRYHAVLYYVPPGLQKQRIKELLMFVELWDRKNSLVKTFSGGMRRRLEIARGFLHHPRVLFLDEPTLGLDPQTRKHIWDYVKELNQKEHTTVFFTTHYIEEAEQIAQKVAIIDYGKIVAQDRPSGLMRKTKTASLEEAFLSLTGKEIREESADVVDRMRIRIRNRMGRS